MLLENPVLLLVAAGCLLAAAFWGQSALRLDRSWRRIRGLNVAESRWAADLARTAYEKELHNAILYLVLAIIAGVASVVDSEWLWIPIVLVAIPVVMTLVWGRHFVAQSFVLEERANLERRQLEVADQEVLAPSRWAARLAPEQLPDFPGFEVGQVYEPGEGMMAGDFYDVYMIGPDRLVAIIGDVSGHGIEPSITAFQVKYLLRAFMRQYRDPAQALEVLNTQISAQMAAQDRSEEFVSLVAAVFDQNVGTLRYASAGHPPAWLWHGDDVAPLRSTGPTLAMETNSSFSSKEVPLDPGDLLLLYTDGLAEARSGPTLFGEDRIAQHVRRDPRIAPDVLCKSLLASARDFSDAGFRDDVAILAIRRV